MANRSEINARPSQEGLSQGAAQAVTATPGSQVKHKTDHWYQLTHWEKPNRARCGVTGEDNYAVITRWHWRHVTCPDCLRLHPNGHPNDSRPETPSNNTPTHP